MRHGLVVALVGIAMMMPSSDARAQQDVQGCAAGPATMPPELAGWPSRRPITASSDASGLRAATLEIGSAVDAMLKSISEVRYPIRPEKPGGSVSHGGLFAFTVKQAGTYRVALGSEAWIAAATARGAWTAIDIYPYLAGQTMLQAFLVPGWAADGGRDAMLTRFKDPKLRPQLVEAAEYAMATRLGGAEGIALPDLGKRLTDIMAAENIGAGEAVLRTLERDPYTRANMTFGDEKDVIAFLQYPDTAVACDCGASIKNRGHPRYFGSFPKILGHYVRDTGTITMEDAVRKMSALPAAIIGMVDRGHIAPGMRADVMIFDPKTVRDHATFDAPTLPSDGVRHVIVNGVPALEGGAATGAKSGAVLLRDAHMPSRPMNTAKARSFTASGRSADYSVTVTAKQAAGERFATGTVKLTDVKLGTVWTADRLGTVQTTKGWASVTAVLKDKAGNRKAATLTLDRADGSAEAPLVTVALGGEAATVLPAKGAVQAE